MTSRVLRLMGVASLLGVVLILGLGTTAVAQSTATLQGTVLDPQGNAVPNATVTVRNLATGGERTAESDSAGNFQVASLPVGTYRVEIKRAGFQTLVVKEIALAVATIAAQNFQLKIGEVSETMEVSSDAPVVETTTITVGQVINSKTVQEIPLNGRHFVDLGLLIPGSVTPPQSGFLTAPLRGQGSFQFNTAGQREDTVNYMINGVNLNDMVQNQITFQPSINTVQEFKVDNSTYSAEFGRNSGAIVNIATRSGANEFHGEGFEFLRNERLDAKNFFASPTQRIPPFKRNQFGAALGGPIWKNHTFFFFSYEGLRQRQGLTTNTVVPKDSERAAATNSTVRKLLDLIPKANSNPDPVSGERRSFVGSGVAPVDIDQWTLDLSHNIGKDDRLHGYYAFQRDLRQEPVLQGNNIPGFGDTRQARRQIFTLNETHIFSPSVANEARFGFNRIHITFNPNTGLNPADFGIDNGLNRPIGLPQINVTNAVNFGGPAGFPQGRGDLTWVFSDTLSYLRGRHSFKFGGEVRRFYNNGFNEDTGTFNFANVGDFISGRAERFSVNLGSGASRIVQTAWGVFVMDSYKVRTNLTLELGFRYDLNLSPTEAKNRFIVFDPKTSSLVQAGTGGIDKVYDNNQKNFQPRIGFAWDPFGTGKTSVRGAYAIQVDQPVTNLVNGLPTNPPLVQRLLFTGAGGTTTTFATARTDAVAAGLAPLTVNPGFDNAYAQSWNLNVQREITPTVGLMIGYFGSKGTHLRIARNLNQPVNGVRPFPRLKSSTAFPCPVLPATTCPAIGNIQENTSAGNSSYNALWISANKRLSRGLQFNASYTYSHSIDYNSLSTQGIVVQDSNNLRGDRASSDFDARNRFVINALYELPFKGNRLIEGWQLSSIVQWQSGNPLNILAGSPPSCPPSPRPPTPGCGGPSNSSFTGVASLRPDLTGAVQIFRDPSRWFSNTVCNPFVNRISQANCQSGSIFTLPLSGTGIYHFGNLGRNALIGPRFANVDFSVLKRTRITEIVRVEFRADFFNLFNHPNFGNPRTVAIAGDPNFSQIERTRFPTGDSGTSRQIQFALKLIF